MRTQLASATTRAVNAASRRFGRGAGTVAGGRAGLRVDPKLLEHLSAGRQVALVSGTNGKTTTTRLLTVGLGAGGDAVVSNETGSNMPPGHVAALVGSDAPRAVLEVDEVWLPRVLSATSASAAVLLNLSRDQLDRTNEVRMVAGRWRGALAAAPRTHVVANADDPLVVWGAGAASDAHWVGAGLRWQLDAVGCPSCEGRIEFGEGTWACRDCGFARPVTEVELVRGGGGGEVGGGDDGVTVAVWADGRRHAIRLALPGRFNQANALLAAVAAEACGIDALVALDAMAEVTDVAGRFTVRAFGPTRARLMLAKNPAGWDELLDLVAGGSAPLVVSINARVADGADPSWLWDVPFERLAGRTVVATGDRYRDLSVRLRYAGVAHSTEADPVRAVAATASAASAGGAGPDGGDPDTVVDVIGNYTAFHESARGARVSRLLRVAVVFPDLLGTYGDGGNGLILARRAEWRGRDVELLQAASDAPVPEADIYCLGGGEDGPQVRAARTLIDDGMLAARVAGGAVVLAVCAGFQVVGRSFPGADGEAHEGVGLLDVETVKGSGPRAVGEVVAEAVGVAGLPAADRLREPRWRDDAVGRHERTRPRDRWHRQRRWQRGRRARPRRRDVPARPRAGAEPGVGRPAAVVGPRRPRAGAARRRRRGRPAGGATRRQRPPAAPGTTEATAEVKERKGKEAACERC